MFQGKDEGVRHKLASRVEVASRAEVGRWRGNQKAKKNSGPAEENQRRKEGKKKKKRKREKREKRIKKRKIIPFFS